MQANKLSPDPIQPRMPAGPLMAWVSGVMVSFYTSVVACIAPGPAVP